MIRLLRSTVLQVLSLLNLSRNLAEEGTISPNIVKACLDVPYTDQNFDVAKTLDDLIRQLEGCVAALDNGEVIGLDLVDKMIKVLQSPYAANAIAGKTLTSLKKAILLPSEIKAFQAEVDKQERYCSNCGKPLQTNELGVIFHSAEGSHVRCSACAKPLFVTCAQRKHTIPIRSDTFMRVLNKIQNGCEHCQAEAAGAPVNDSGVSVNTPQPAQTAEQAAADEVMRRMRERLERAHDERQRQNAQVAQQMQAASIWVDVDAPRFPPAVGEVTLRPGAARVPTPGPAAERRQR